VSVTETPPSATKPPGGLADIRSWVTVALILGFFAAYALNWYRSDSEALNLMNGALVGGFAAAYGYWLGSSRSSDAKTATIDTLASKMPADTPSAEGT
jgi:hypothetical protein